MIRINLFGFVLDGKNKLFENDYIASLDLM
jgi:hypothetical protein